MDPNIWGPHAWFFLHSVALAYPENPNEEEKIQYYNFFKSLSFVLPCTVCRENYKNHFMKNKLKNNLNNKTDINKWLVEIHNSVNKIHKKKKFTYEQFTKMYDEIYKNNKQYNSPNPFYNLNKLESFSNKNNASIFSAKKIICTLRNLFIIILIIVTMVLGYKFLFKKYSLKSK